jgi:HD-GYP domain-containing protein (c-di-GMP phosphodiesterase class II)
MSKQIVKTSVEQLRIGAFVHELDRPWTETPFLFQGFTIQSEEEIAELRRLCREVYIEVSVADREEPKRAVATRLNGGSPQEDPLQDVSRNLGSLLTRPVVKDPVPLRTELRNVRGAYADAKRAVGNVFDRLRDGRELDVGQLSGVVDWMVDSVFRNRDAMSWLARMKSKDDYLYRHSLAASVWALAFGRHLGLDKSTLQSIGMGAMLLDVGKTRLPSELLVASHQPSKEEWKALRSHVAEGVKIAQEATGADGRVLAMIDTHHERFDGTGYPAGLKGGEIQLVGSIAGLVDAYDAMTTARPYAKLRSNFDAIRELQRLGDSWFQRDLIELFVQAVGVFPTGTLVELNTGEVAVVISQNRFRRLRPEIMLLLEANKTLRKDFTIVDLNTCEANHTAGQAGLWIERAVEPDAYGIDPTEFFL